MVEIRIDSNVAALEFIEILFEKGEINKATFTNIMKHKKSMKNEEGKLNEARNESKSILIIIIC